MKIKILICFTFLFCMLFFNSNLSFPFADITQVYTPEDFQILDFVLVDSSQNEDILTKIFKLKVKNISQNPLYSVRCILIYVSDQAIIEKGEVYLGNINPDEIILSSDSFIFSVNIAKVKIIPEINFHWKTEYENVEGEWIENEILLNGNLN